MRNKRRGIGSLVKAIDILFLFTDTSPLGVRDIAQRLQIPATTAYRFVRTLRDRGLLEQDPQTRKYQLGLRLLELEGPILKHLDVRRAALPHMEDLAEHCNETVQLTLRRGTVGVCIEVVESSEPLRVAPARGQSVPLHSGALAKAILAFLPKAEMDGYLDSGPLRRFTPNTLTEPNRLREELARIRKGGYAISLQEVYLGAAGVAAPIFDGAGRVVASLGVSGPIHRLTTSRLTGLAPEVLRHAEKISAQLGAA